ncbi:rab effector Noc2 isoform X2 [Erinaceus europaeus]|uniref:Rab effector Noc2 isoform X2 n=1 Tax=Erinaceus europaeus TaxID=9365 RepID=A0ABM3WTH1_ERIEU|nr:rab effector Noc2 isoform X2 [Erinaceus europaeus]
MADTIFSSGNDQWVCPNDRQLALRAKLQTGWSVHTYQTEKQRKSQCLSPTEVDTILQVIQRAERLDVLEQQRIGRLVERLETMRRNVLGNGLSQCLLCGELLGFLGSSSVFCKDCRKVWKRSGAWFYKGLPKYILPLKTPGQADDPHLRPQPLEPTQQEPRSTETSRVYTWARGRGKAQPLLSWGSTACSPGGQQSMASPPEDLDRHFLPSSLCPQLSTLLHTQGA